eukprot:COSAG02_NODE_40147_length_408_cov_3.932039_1_plen_30_part_10
MDLYQGRNGMVRTRTKICVLMLVSSFLCAG